MPPTPPPSNIPQTPWKSVLIGWAAAQVIRLVSLTLRYELEDPHGITSLGTDQRLIWIFWHNRIFCQPIIYRKYLRHRTISVLTSASKDGAIIAQTVRRFGLGFVRGSSSRRAAQAGAELIDCLQSGSDIGITPDGPRGPCYQLAMGPVRLAEMTSAPLVSINANYSKCWQLRSWDRFRIPKPFSKVRVSFGAPHHVSTGAELDPARQAAQDYLLAGTLDDLISK
jgi:lysophospholipid acyltransferase (LPLAT)-like uncharacterized protein